MTIKIGELKKLIDKRINSLEDFINSVNNAVTWDDREVIIIHGGEEVRIT